MIKPCRMCNAGSENCADYVVMEYEAASKKLDQERAARIAAERRVAALEKACLRLANMGQVVDLACSICQEVAVEAIRDGGKGEEA